ncbi:recombinase family protein [Candidatus Neptunochlamydia vexilliferae]|uniref:Serine recombinase gin n=1 Tax=Candidatus Neptunichlamydia vexilliferae TaxID=1651774 RepID=A0ABS0B100_9BACT|nr:recombinase family protein [Candidatus Neptunochlamydia vexilliferae]MBF5060046.1 Serine recombinase gin [Candidatus Neptunochlamydia vexilliferae]
MNQENHKTRKGLLVGYARVSTFDQNPQMQIDALIQEGIDSRHLFEEKTSGSTLNRPKLKEALDFLKAGDILVVWKLDRLGRSLQDLIQIIQELKKREIGFKSLTEGIDTTSPGGMLIFHIFGSLAEFGRELIRERTLAGLESARRQGRKGGRPKSLNDEQRETLKELIEQGRGVSYIARTLNTSRFTIYREKKSLI